MNTENLIKRGKQLDMFAAFVLIVGIIAGIALISYSLSPNKYELTTPELMYYGIGIIITSLSSFFFCRVISGILYSSNVK